MGRWAPPSHPACRTSSPQPSWPRCREGSRRGPCARTRANQRAVEPRSGCRAEGRDCGIPVHILTQHKPGVLRSGLVVTISSSGATYLPSAISEYSGVATSGALDQTAVSKGVGLSADSGPTSVVAGGELVFGALITGGQPLSVTPGSSQGVPFITNAFNGSRSADTQAIYVGEAGAQNARFVLGQNMDWYAAVATFRPAP